MDLLAPAATSSPLLNLLLLGLAVWACADARSGRPPPSRPPASSPSPPGSRSPASAWPLCLLGVGLLGLFGLVVAVAVIVYLVDVRPAVREPRPGGPWG